MYAAKIKAVKETPQGTLLEVLLPFESKTDEINRLKGKDEYLKGVIYFNDGRLHSDKQHRAIFAIIGDIARWWADDREWTRKYFQDEFCGLYDIESFSLSHLSPDCASVSLARHFITYLLEVCLKEGIPLRESGLRLTDDTDKYLYLCIKYRKCAICGIEGETHHIDAIGMGRDRKHYDDWQHKKICLCREHHSEAHTLGAKTFKSKYHIYGIKYIERAVDNE